MIKKVIKKDGTVAEFDRDKIVKAVLKSGESTHSFGKEMADLISNIVITEIEHEHDNPLKKSVDYEGINSPISIEIFQNKIEQVLMRKGFYETAKSFILYREKRRELRELKTHVTPNLLEEYLSQGTWEVRENANIDYSIQGLKAFISGKAEEIYWLEKVYPKKIADLHKDGWVHIHNLSFLGAYCVGWDLEDLIKRGFGGVPGKPYSSPAKHLSAILGQMMNFLFTLQNEAAGAVAFSSFDTLLAPFVRYDRLLYKEVKQHVQEFIYNMNQTMRTGGQSPFSNLTLDITPPLLLRNKNATIGGREIREVYGDFQEEMNMINQAFWETMIEGDGNKRVFTFPIPTLNVDKNFPWGDPRLDTMWEATAKYGTPYFANYVNSDLSPEDARSMCLDGSEEIIFSKASNQSVSMRATIGELVEENIEGYFDSEGWANAKADIQVLSFNPGKQKTEWANVLRFLRIFDTEALEITLEDGKKAIYSNKHPVPVIVNSLKRSVDKFDENDLGLQRSNEGINPLRKSMDYKGLNNAITMKFARDVVEGDVMLVVNIMSPEQTAVNVKVKKIRKITFRTPHSFYDLELQENHMFVHSYGQVSFNCCRLKLDVRELKNKGGGLFGANPLTGSVGVITINMPRIGYLSKDEGEFFHTLNEIMDASCEALELKRKTVEQFTEAGLYPYSRIYLDSVKKATGHYWDNHFSTIGIIGMNEALANFMGENITTKQGVDFTIKVMRFMRSCLEKFQEETSHMFNLEATPAESTSYSLAMKDKKKYPDIITAGTEKTPYYTNSTQLPVGYTDDPFDAASLQNEIQSLYSGGTVLHFFLGERLTSGKYAEVFVKKIIENFKLPYITLTPTFSICPKHGYIPGEHKYCPYCDEELARGVEKKTSINNEVKPKFIINL